MVKISILVTTSLLLLTSCAAMPELFKAAEDIATDTAVKIEIDKEALQKETDVIINVSVKNKDQPT